MDLSDLFWVLALICFVTGSAALTALVFGAFYAIPGALLPAAVCFAFIGWVLGRVRGGE